MTAAATQVPRKASIWTCRVSRAVSLHLQFFLTGAYHGCVQSAWGGHPPKINMNIMLKGKIVYTNLSAARKAAGAEIRLGSQWFV